MFPVSILEKYPCFLYLILENFAQFCFSLKGIWMELLFWQVHRFLFLPLYSQTSYRIFLIISKSWIVKKFAETGLKWKKLTVSFCWRDLAFWHRSLSRKIVLVSTHVFISPIINKIVLFLLTIIIVKYFLLPRVKGWTGGETFVHHLLCLKESL